jgi:hypothetical protein
MQSFIGSIFVNLDWNTQDRRKGGREEDQRRRGVGQLWKRHRDKEGRGGR